MISTAFACSEQDHSSFETDDTLSEIEGYDLVWHDEFNEGIRPDTSNWSHERGFVRNEELQWYQPENASIEDGRLIIEGRREQIKNSRYDSTSSNWRRSRPFAEYTSSSINTRGKQSFQYGIIEVRARIDTARGLWPAIWTLGTHPDRGWPANGETDIMEYYLVDSEPHILANAAWADANNRPVWNDRKVPFQEFLDEDPQWPEKYHIWKMNWNQDRIQLYLDDRLLNEIDLSKTLNADGFNPFHQPHYILLNLALGSNGGDPSNTQFPKQYEVDYVRVYQQQ
ncbi:MAG: glycoside hydrolase family 16 protein [Balneolaceae bacterium]|nr:glycoside hydrolase family 16 protein [Balneolaceae bacterium]